MSDRICSLKGCSQKRYRFMMCKQHYENYKEYGNPLISSLEPTLPVDKKLIVFFADKSLSRVITRECGNDVEKISKFITDCVIRRNSYG